MEQERPLVQLKDRSIYPSDTKEMDRIFRWTLVGVILVLSALGVGVIFF